jgi:hypothetical protein
MNAVSALLFTVLVHIAGADIDVAREAHVAVRRNAAIESRWDLVDAGAGVYRFVGERTTLVVERIRGSELAYAVVHFSDARMPGGISESPVADRTVLSIGAISMLNAAASLSVEDPAGDQQFTLDTASIALGWTAGVEHAAAQADDAQADDAGAAEETSAEQQPNGALPEDAGAVPERDTTPTDPTAGRPAEDSPTDQESAPAQTAPTGEIDVGRAAGTGAEQSVTTQEVAPGPRIVVTVDLGGWSAADPENGYVVTLAIAR